MNKKQDHAKRRKTDVNSDKRRERQNRAIERNLAKMVNEGCRQAWEKRGITLTKWKGREQMKAGALLNKGNESGQG